MWNWLRRLFGRKIPAPAVPSRQGTVKRIVRDKGFGFIRDTDGQEVFFHRSALVGVEMRALSEGQGVEFVLEESPKGPRASSVRATREKAEGRKTEPGAGDGVQPGTTNGRQQAEDRNKPARRHGRRGKRRGAEGQRSRGDR